MKSRFFAALGVSVVSSFVLIEQASACDLCAIHQAIQIEKEVPRDFKLTVAEQYTDYDQLQFEGSEVDNPGNQSFDSFITQVGLNYGITEKLGVQLSLPFIYRSYDRIEGGEKEDGSVSGLGDISVIGNYTPVVYEEGDVTAIWRVSAGVKLPTGDAHRLGEEAAEGHSHGEMEMPVAPVEDHHLDEAEMEDAHAGHDEHEHARFNPQLAHEGNEHGTEIPSVVHGHDLALGSGSVDLFFGTGLFLQKSRFFFSGSMQYLLRNEGAFGYEYADAFLWQAGPGAFLVVDDNYTLALQAAFSGEDKGEDTFRGEKTDDTSVTSVFLGPQLFATWGSALGAELGVDFPLDIDNSGLQTVADSRVRLAVSYRF